MLCGKVEHGVSPHLLLVPQGVAEGHGSAIDATGSSSKTGAVRGRRRSKRQERGQSDASPCGNIREKWRWCGKAAIPHRRVGQVRASGNMARQSSFRSKLQLETATSTARPREVGTTRRRWQAGSGTPRSTRPENAATTSRWPEPLRVGGVLKEWGGIRVRPNLPLGC